MCRSLDHALVVVGHLRGGKQVHCLDLEYNMHCQGGNYEIFGLEVRGLAVVVGSGAEVAAELVEHEHRQAGVGCTPLQVEPEVDKLVVDGTDGQAL